MKSVTAVVCISLFLILTTSCKFVTAVGCRSVLLSLTTSCKSVTALGSRCPLVACFGPVSPRVLEVGEQCK